MIDRERTEFVVESVIHQSDPAAVVLILGRRMPNGGIELLAAGGEGRIVLTPEEAEHLAGDINSHLGQAFGDLDLETR